MLRNCCRFVAKYLVCVLFLFCQFSVDPALECTAPTVSGVDLAEFSVCGGRSVDWSECTREWYAGVRWEKLKARDHLEELGIDARIILQDRLYMYDATLWRVRVAIFHCTHNNAFCVLLSYMSLSAI
jgi:hypothetical protein